MNNHAPASPPQWPNGSSSNIWGSKFPLFGLAVILFFVALVWIRACTLGVPLSDVFRNTDAPPAAADSTRQNQ